MINTKIEINSMIYKGKEPMQYDRVFEEQWKEQERKLFDFRTHGIQSFDKIVLTKKRYACTYFMPGI